MAIKLIFTRHGETADNAINRLSTSPPGPELSALGREQAANLAELVRGHDFTAIYASPLVRAHQTAQAVAEGRGLTVILEDDLRELSVGELEGRNDDGVFEELDVVWLAWTIDGKLDLPAGPGGEAAREVLARAVPAIHRIAAAEPDGTVLIVAHSGILQLLLPALCDNLSADYGYRNWLRNCQVVEVVAAGAGFRCVTWAGVPVPATLADAT